MKVSLFEISYQKKQLFDDIQIFREAPFFVCVYMYIYSGYGKYSDPLKFFTLCYIAAIC